MRLLLHIARGLLTAAIVLPHVVPQRRDEIISNWSRGLLQVFNIRLVTLGEIPAPAAGGIMFVANHVSWVDISAINSVRAVRFVAKAEIRSWPLFGWLTAQANTLFTDRARRQDAKRMVEATANSLRDGDCLCYFPEGTTTDGTRLMPFKSSLMQAAIHAGAPIWPIGIRYPGIDGQPNMNLSYADVSLVRSLGNVLKERGPVVELHFAKPISTAAADRRELADQARKSIAESIGLNR